MTSYAVTYTTTRTSTVYIDAPTAADALREANEASSRLPLITSSSSLLSSFPITGGSSWVPTSISEKVTDGEYKVIHSTEVGYLTPEKLTRKDPRAHE
jgi:hypothetical protein